MTGGNPHGYLQAWQMMFNSKLLRINPDIAVSVGLQGPKLRFPGRQCD